MKIDPKTVYAVDLSMAGMIRIYGADAPRFVRTMYSGSMEQFDTLYGISQGMILSSEGEVMDMAAAAALSPVPITVPSSPCPICSRASRAASVRTCWASVWTTPAVPLSWLVLS